MNHLVRMFAKYEPRYNHIVCKRIGCIAQRLEHYVDIVGVPSSILGAPTNRLASLKSG